MTYGRDTSEPQAAIVQCSPFYGTCVVGGGSGIRGASPAFSLHSESQATDMLIRARLPLLMVLMLAAALPQHAQAIILPIILPPNLLWYGGYTSSPVLGPGLGYAPAYPAALPGLSPYGAAGPRPALPGLYPGALPGLAGRPAIG
ncbi:Thymidylate kinase [Frankliniella fusca]|uniref:Thymidylate kinase n=1 Tax=Frankliniella fusca TaxID=407009 RepID=A0AAE1LQ14_9NEOP|nr:Thymidylate kinase [Frankliniella fusca]